jgi:SAM-dependent methyltransferase
MWQGKDSGKDLGSAKQGPGEKIVHAFYQILRKEVCEGNMELLPEEQKKLQSHYPIMMDPDHYPPPLAATIYANRRTQPVDFILESVNPIVFDAGCGFGSESYLFASVGAKVVAVDHSAEQIAIAKKRKRNYERIFGKSLDIQFIVANLDEYVPEKINLSLTWVASVLAAIQNQDLFLERIYQITRPGGKIMVTDMNMRNPLFLAKEWKRRKGAFRENREFAAQSSFWGMVGRKGRKGARYFPRKNAKDFDDVQFFTPRTLTLLLKKVGFEALAPSFNGFIPPFMGQNGLHRWENIVAKIPWVKDFGYFYLITGIKD